jgi:hypothetical protein
MNNYFVIYYNGLGSATLHAHHNSSSPERVAERLINLQKPRRPLWARVEGGRSASPTQGLLAYRELDDVLGLTELAGTVLSDRRRGKNTRHLLTGLLRQSVFGRLAGYEDVNDADRLSRDPAMRAVVDRKGLDRIAASTSQMARFETQWFGERRQSRGIE